MSRVELWYGKYKQKRKAEPCNEASKASFFAKDFENMTLLENHYQNLLYIDIEILYAYEI